MAERGITSAGADAAEGAGPGRDPRTSASIAIRSSTPSRPSSRTPIATPTPEQQRALEQLLPLAAARQFHVALMHGVTGSGKTEVYLRLADAVRKSGRGVLMLVPEIALTPQVAALFRARFGDRRRDSAQRPLGRRASRSVASHPAR